MKTISLKVLPVAACLAVLGGCFQTETKEPSEELAKSTASQAVGCSKYQAFITGWATEILDCAQSGDVEGCVPDIARVFEPAYACLDMEFPDESELTSFNDLIGLSQDFGDAVSEFENDESSALGFIDCFCGGSGSGSSGGVTVSVEGGFGAGSSGAAVGGGFDGGSSSAAVGGGFDAGSSSGAAGGGFGAGTANAGTGFSAGN